MNQILSRVLALFLIVLPLAEAQDSKAGSKRPNILLIYADDLGYGELGCFGQSKIRTPHLDRLATEGTRLKRFYSASTVCAPARCSLLTGKHTGHAAIRGNKETREPGPNGPEGQHPLPAAEVTIAEHLRARGYATALIGKWGLGAGDTEGHPNRQGFDHFFGYLCQRHAHNHYPSHLWRNSEVVPLEGNARFAAHQKLIGPLASEQEYARYQGSDYAPELAVQEAVDFIARSKDRPFLLAFTSPLPHVALQAPQTVVATYPKDWDATPYLGDRGYLPTARPRATYAAMITFLDESVGRLLSALATHGLAERTLVVFTSDNGATFNGGTDRAFFASNGSLRGHKTNLYEGGIRVPFLARWPGQIPKGASSTVPAFTPDLLATFLDAADGEAPKAEVAHDGVSLLSLLRGENHSVASRPVLYFEFPEGPGQVAVLLEGRYKAIRPNLKKSPELVEIYDLSSDPTESKNIADSEPALVAKALTAMKAAHTPSKDFPIPALDP